MNLLRDYKTKEEVAEIQRKAQQIIDEWGINELKGASGLYFIKIYDKILYIGESQTDLAYRLARHKMHILDPNDEPEEKYNIMREVFKHFEGEIKVFWQIYPPEICLTKENELIAQYKPILNNKIPIYNEFFGVKNSFPCGYCYKDLPSAEEVIWYIQSGERP